MTPESRQFLRYVAAQPKGRVGYPADRWEEAQALARECVAKAYVRHRPLWPFKEGFQLTEAGKAYLGALD